MKFVYYRSLASCFDVSFEKLDDEYLKHLKDKAERYFQSNDLLSCENQTLSMTEVFALIDSLSNPTTIVFHDWIKSDKAIKRILIGNVTSSNLQESITNKKYKGHALEKQFYDFLTPYLLPLIEKETKEFLIEKDFEKLHYYLQFSTFIKESKKIALQQQVDQELRQMLLKVKSFFDENNRLSNNTHSWEKNGVEIELLASLELVGILNLLDKQFYALRVTYIDTVKAVLVQPEIDPQTFKKLARAISRVELNSAHKSQVESFLQQGKQEVNKKQKTKVFNKALLRNPLTYIGIVIIMILIVLIFPFKFNDDVKPKNQKITGLDSLSQDEVLQTDSLLAFNEDSVLFETDDMTVPDALPDFILSDNSSDIKNTVAVKLYESMLNDYEIQQNMGEANCDPVESSKLQEFNYNGVERFQTQFSNHTFINKSSEDCYLLIFENKKEGSVYGKFVPAGGETNLKLVKNWRVIFYTGQDFTKFNPLKTSNNGYGNLEDAKKIDEVFTAHFCDMSYSNFRILSKIYHVASISKSTSLYNNKSGALEIESNTIKRVL